MAPVAGAVAKSMRTAQVTEPAELWIWKTVQPNGSVDTLTVVADQVGYPMLGSRDRRAGSGCPAGLNTNSSSHGEDGRDGAIAGVHCAARREWGKTKGFNKR